EPGEELSGHGHEVDGLDEFVHSVSLLVMDADSANRELAVAPRGLSPDPFDAAPAAEDQDLLGYCQTLWKRKLTFLSIALLGAIGGLLLTLPVAPVYQSSSLVEITVPNENALNFKDAAGSLFDYLDNYLQTQVKVIESDSLTKVVI